MNQYNNYNPNMQMQQQCPRPKPMGFHILMAIFFWPWWIIVFMNMGHNNKARQCMAMQQQRNMQNTQNYKGYQIVFQNGVYWANGKSFQNPQQAYTYIDSLFAQQNHQPQTHNYKGFNIVTNSAGKFIVNNMVFNTLADAHSYVDSIAPTNTHNEQINK